MARKKPAPAKEPLTGYQVCIGMVEVIEAQRGKLLERQKLPLAAQKGLVAEIHNLARSAAVVQAELRKTHDDAVRAVKGYPIERQVELVLGMFKRWPPEYRKAASDYLAELGLGVLV